MDKTFEFIINELKNGIDKGYNVLKPEMKELIEQIIKYEITSRIVYLIIWLLIIFISIFALIKSFKNFDVYSEIIVFPIVVSAFLCIAGFLYWLININTIIKLYFAPKLYILEFLKDYLSN